MRPNPPRRHPKHYLERRDLRRGTHMPLSYDFIEKPTHVALIDQFFSGTPDELRDAYDYARSILEQGIAIEETTTQVAHSEHEALQSLTQDDAEHFRQHWLDPE